MLSKFNLLKKSGYNLNFINAINRLICSNLIDLFIIKLHIIFKYISI